MKHSRQHIIPRFYLSEWLEPVPPKGQSRAIWRISRDGSNPHRRAPQKTFVETDRYTVILPNGDRDLMLQATFLKTRTAANVGRVEHKLDGIESDFSRVLKRLQHGDQLTRLDKAKVATFKAAMLGRTKPRADNWRDAWANIRGIVARFEKGRSSPSASGTDNHWPPPALGSTSVSTAELDELLLNSHPNIIVFEPSSTDRQWQVS